MRTIDISLYEEVRQQFGASLDLAKQSFVVVTFEKCTYGTLSSESEEITIVRGS